MDVKLCILRPENNLFGLKERRTATSTVEPTLGWCGSISVDKRKWILIITEIYWGYIMTFFRIDIWIFN